LADRIGDTPLQTARWRKNAARIPRCCCAFAGRWRHSVIFSVDDSGNIAHTARSRLLRSDSRPTLHHAARYWTMPSNWDAWAALEDAVRTGKPAFETVFGVPNFAYLEGHPDQARLFDAFMQHSPDDRHQAVVEAYEFSAAKLLVDVGGGNGGLLRQP
jgi:hypothetical protein